MYKSPQHDMGYDISDYQDVHAPYGTVSDLEELIKGCHDRGMKLLLDLVVNHTSNEHPWFKEARKSKDNPKRDWYIWRPAKYDKDGKRKPPNNWRSHFGGSAWEWDKATEEYYLHLFVWQQPDLNWENPAMRNAIYEEAMNFWLEKGVDGFRIDTVNMYDKGTELADVPVVDHKSEWQAADNIFCNGPRMHEFMREMNAKSLSKYDAMTVGELPNTPDPAHVLRYISAGDPQLNMVFNFDTVDIGQGRPWKFDVVPWKLTDLKRTTKFSQNLIEGTDAWTTVFIENHDQGRSISRFASDDPKYHVVSGKMLATMLTTLTGTLFIYQGQEIGMVNVPKDWSIENYQDVESLNYHNSVRKWSGGDKAALDKAFHGIQIVGRDHARTPVLWDDSPNAGFTTGKPWMRVLDRYKEINVKKQQGDKSSILNFWKMLLRMRKEYRDLFTHGSFRIYDEDNQEVFTYKKEFEGQRALVALNFTKERQKFMHPKELEGKLEMLISNVEGSGEDILQPWEGRVYLVK